MTTIDDNAAARLQPYRAEAQQYFNDLRGSARRDRWRNIFGSGFVFVIIGLIANRLFGGGVIETESGLIELSAVIFGIFLIAALIAIVLSLILSFVRILRPVAAAFSGLFILGGILALLAGFGSLPASWLASAGLTDAPQDIFMLLAMLAWAPGLVFLVSFLASGTKIPAPHSQAEIDGHASTLAAQAERAAALDTESSTANDSNARRRRRR